MSQDHQSEVTQILRSLSAGDESAAQRLLPHVYDQLRALAGGFFRRQAPGHTLQPTALVHEAFLKLVSHPESEFSGRRHFYDVAAMAMRQLLADHARQRKTAKRGDGALRVTLDDSAAVAATALDVDLVSLDDAMRKLGQLDRRQERIVELRFLAGLSVEDTAEVLGISPRTVKRDWQMARAWLRRELNAD
ncbi:MAG TPA: sigma-70 family RNA polymerase sigma factor [Phycisphaerae bacterium]|nr:sigma-70 family RNA polymerase sigma factor [Phycisphaerae bacterium]HRW55600.1 sigma-70 family RNA polymerase sigma factor [Phycisphaerae bacterium]